jgi:hypothetical protein
LLAIFDEASFWRGEASVAPDVETYHAVAPGLATLPGSMLVGISSPHRKVGLLYERLGGSANMFHDFPGKPKGMHWRTYDRLRRAHDIAYTRSTTALMQFVNRIGRQFSRRREH